MYLMRMVSTHRRDISSPPPSVPSWFQGLRKKNTICIVPTKWTTSLWKIHRVWEIGNQLMPQISGAQVLSRSPPTTETVHRSRRGEPPWSHMVLKSMCRSQLPLSFFLSWQQRKTHCAISRRSSPIPIWNWVPSLIRRSKIITVKCHLTC